MNDLFFQPVKSVIKIKETTNKALARLNIFLVRDLLFYKPYHYLIRDNNPNLAALQTGNIIQATIEIAVVNLSKSRNSPTKIDAFNDTGKVTLIFFNKIPPFILTKLKIGSKHIITGKVQKFDNFSQITHPEFLLKKELTSPIEPIYHLTYGLTNKQLYSYIISIIKRLELIIDHPQEISQQPYLTELLEELKLLHLIEIDINKNINLITKQAIEKLSKKELFANQLALFELKMGKKTLIAHSFSPCHKMQQKILANLDFDLTKAQEQAIAEITVDQQNSAQMLRLLQGDVGSGKTLVALITMLAPINSAFQVALMAPTDLLAVQHFQFFLKALKPLTVKVALLTGKTKIAERRKIDAGLKNGEIDILIGTHALFQSNVQFRQLGYVVIDEQHRFGVKQRLKLTSKAANPDLLVMTATPIPRSLSLTIFGNMDVSLLKSKPKNRLPIITSIMPINKLDFIINSLQKKLLNQEKIYWVCPLIDQNDQLDKTESSSISLANVHDRYRVLSAIYSTQVQILHGKMKSVEKDQAMQAFKAGEIKILVSTTVIEVGIDVSDATLIIIENAEKFGLAQLHQLRGRVGRGDLQSHCILLYNPLFLSKTAKKRLEIMRASEDGFYLAEQDLLLRGSGEILGTQQSGEPSFFFADLAKDGEYLTAANNLASQTLKSPFTNFQQRLFNRDYIRQS